MKNEKSKVLIIHLPQFHRIPENDAWWGEGFTEWTNVKRGRPFYPGHYQPRVPLGGDYYDLSDLTVLERQTRLAREAGAGGFAFYHYYFAGKTLLEKPIESYRDHSAETFPYCLIWANQSFARTWYRADAGNQMLLEQCYGQEKEWREQFYYLLPFFQDERYIKIENKPIYGIYLPQDNPCRKEMFALWREEAVKCGFAGLYLMAMDVGWAVDKVQTLYDAYIKFEPIRTIFRDDTYRHRVQWVRKHKYMDMVHPGKHMGNYFHCQNAYSYSWLCSQMEDPHKGLGRKKTFLGAFAGWDNTPRKDEAGFIVRNSTPQRFGEHIEKMLRLSEERGNEYLFLNAWNEWSEGAYIEPDERWGYGYLEQLKEAVERYEKD